MNGYNFGEYKFDPMDPEFQKYLDQRMGGRVPELTMPDSTMPTQQAPSFDLPQLETGDLDMPEEQGGELARLQASLMEKYQNREADQEAFKASRAQAGQEAGPSGFQRGAGIFAAAMQGMATKGQDLSVSGKLKKGWDVDKQRAIAGVVDPSIEQRKQLDELIKMKALERGDKSFEQQKELKQMSLDESRERTKEGQEFQTKLAEKKAGIAEKVRLAKPTEGVKTMDREFAKDYNTWNTSGRGTYDKNMKRLRDARAILVERKDDYMGTSGRMTGRLPDWMRSGESIALREDIHAAAQGALRATLGAQFTEKEGERIMAASYNEKQDPQINIDKIDKAIAELETNAGTMDSRASYFGEQGTLKGWSPEQKEAARSVAKTAGAGVAKIADKKLESIKKWLAENPDDPRADAVRKKAGL